LVTRTIRKQMLVPIEETVKVPVVRKEVNRHVAKQTIKAQRLVPVQKFKEVQETTLEVKEEMVNGRREKRAVPVTRTRRQPYTDFVEEEYDVVVDVPKQEVVTRTGYRMDKHVTSKLMEVEEDHVYELRPVLVKKGECRHRELADHHTFKKAHGVPVWDSDTQHGWLGKPQTPAHKPHLHRPSSASSILSGAAKSMTGHGGTLKPSTSHGALRRPATGARSLAQGESLL